MSPAISSEKKTAIAMRKKYKASTRPAIVDARSGNSGVPDPISALPPFLLANHDHDERAGAETRDGARHAQRAHHQQAVAPRHRIVVIAVEQQRIDRRPDLAGRGLDD